MTKINIKGMSCSHCADSVNKAIAMVKGVEKVEVDLRGKCAYIEGKFSLKDAATAVVNAGYEVE